MHMYMETGGHSGIPLNGSETEIYAVTSSNGGVFTHFWITGADKTWIDNAIVSFYIDDDESSKIPSVQFQVNLASGVGFVDYTNDSNTKSEGNCPWGTQYIGKASCAGGWYNNIKVPFQKSFKATIRSYLNCVDQPYSVFSGVDFYGYDIQNGQYYNKTLSECQALCKSNTQCSVYTFHTDFNPTKCELKTSSLGMIPTIPTVYSGDTDGSLCKKYEPKSASMWTVVRGLYNVNDIDIRIGDISLPKSARLVTQSNATGLNPLDYFNIFDFEGSKQKINGGMLLMNTLSVVSGTVNFIEGCFHFYNSANVTFPGELIATGTEDYYDSGWDFEGVYPLHLPNSGETWRENFVANKTNPYGPFTTNGIKWSAYRMHFMDALIFDTDSAKFVWRNGDVNQPVIGKCFQQGNGTPVGHPTFSWVRTLSFVYLW